MRDRDAVVRSTRGTVPTMVFALAYARIATHLSPAACLLASYGVYFAATLLTLTLPIYIITATLAAFSHRQGGASTAGSLMRGLVRGLASFVVFFWLLAFLLTRTTVPLSFAGGLLGCGTMHLVLSRFRIAAPKHAAPAPEPAKG